MSNPATQFIAFDIETDSLRVHRLESRILSSCNSFRYKRSSWLRKRTIPPDQCDRRIFLRVILAPDCLQSFPDSVWVPILLVLPGLAGLQGEFPFEIWKTFDGFSLFPREFEIGVLKLVVKADLTGV